MIWQNKTAQHKVLQVGGKVTLTSQRDYLSLTSVIQKKTDKSKLSHNGNLSSWNREPYAVKDEAGLIEKV